MRLLFLLRLVVRLLSVFYRIARVLRQRTPSWTEFRADFPRPRGKSALNSPPRGTNLELIFLEGVESQNKNTRRATRPWKINRRRRALRLGK